MIRKKHPANPASTPPPGHGAGRYPQEQEAIAVATLQLLASRPELLVKFLDSTGLRPDSLRSQAEDGTLTPALLHHLMGDEQLLVDVAKAVEASPEKVATIASRSTADW